MSAYANALNGTLPSSLANLSKLERLFMRGEHGHLRTTLSRQTALLTLAVPCVAENALSGTIPPSFGQLTSLTELHIGENALSGSLPATISGMTSLEKLVLWENELTTIDPETERPPALRECSLQDCEWACPLPEWATDECHAKCDAHAPSTGSTRDVAQ